MLFSIQRFVSPSDEMDSSSFCAKSVFIFELIFVHFVKDDFLNANVFHF